MSRICDEDFERALARAREGDEAAWASLYDSLAPQVMGYLRVKGATDAEEVLGDVFLHVARGVDAFEGDASQFRSWVFVIATSRLYDERRRMRRKPTDPLEAGVEDHLCSTSDVEAEVERSAAASEVQHLLGALTDDQRAVVELKIFGELTSQEAADILGKPVGAVKAQYRRALGALRRQIDGPATSPPAGDPAGADRTVVAFPPVPLRVPSAVTRGS